MFFLAIAVYALTYYREYMRIPERSSLIHTSGSDSHFLGRVLDTVALRTPFQSATYVFATKTLFRNEKHCLLFGTATAMGFFVSAQTTGQALANPMNSGIDPRLLSVSLTLAFFTIVSLRALLDVPSDRLASWVFRSTVDRYRHEARSVAGKVLVSPVIVWLVIALPLHVMLWGWAVALLHSGYVLMCSIGLAQLLLVRYRKIPFTCSYTASKDKVLVMIILGMAGFALFSEANSRFEAPLLTHPLGFLFVVACFLVLLWRIRVFQSGLTLEERALIYEHRPAPMVQVLNITR
jgi:F0F1-type ATP synthase assembly protein I